MGATLRRNRPLLITVGIVALILLWMIGTYEPRVVASILLSGLTLGALYFLMASGLSLIFGLMDVLNFAHGLLFMLGAYIGFTLYANPRLLLNTIPFVLAIAGTALLVAPFGYAIWRRWPAGGAAVWVQRGLGLTALVIAVVAVRGFDILKLAAFSATAAGGAIATVDAQEPGVQLAGRTALLALTGLLIGVAGARGRSQSPQPLLRSTGWWGGVLAVVLAFALVALRAPGEAAILALDSNLRFVLALLLAVLGGMGIGALVETSMIRPLYSRPIYQVLLTLGLVFVGTEIVKAIWGPAGYFMELPAWFNTRGPNCPSPNVLAWLQDNCASIDVLGRPFPSYRIFLIGLGLVVFVGVAVLLARTRLGMIIRAGVQDSEMVQALGINVRRVFTLVFALGTGLAALGGVAAAPFVGVNTGIGQEFLIQGFIAVVIGGMGSFAGAAAGALLVGLARAFGDQLVLTGIQFPWMEAAVKFSPSISRASTVLIMALVLLLRPAGLFGKKD